MLFSLRQIFYLDFINNYPRKMALVFEAFSIFMGLMIYYYAAKAFSPNLNGDLNFYGLDYFSFIIVGELGLLIPSYLLANPCRRVVDLISSQNFVALQSYPQPLWKTLSLFTVAGSGIELLRLIMNLTLALIFFKLMFSIKVLGLIFLTLLLSAPAFLGLGLFSSALAIIFKRSGGITSHITTFLTFLAGAYFPVEVFPQSVQKVALWLSPFNPLLLLIREIVSGKFSDQFAVALCSLILWNIIGLSLGLISQIYAESHLRKTGSQLIFTR